MGKQIILVFDDWKKNGKSIYRTNEGIKYSKGSLHSGSIFCGTIELNDDEYETINEARKNNIEPTFQVSETQNIRPDDTAWAELDEEEFYIGRDGKRVEK